MVSEALLLTFKVRSCMYTKKSTIPFLQGNPSYETLCLIMAPSQHTQFYGEVLTLSDVHFLWKQVEA